MDNAPVGSVETVETIHLLGSIANFLLTLTLVMICYALLYGAYRLFLAKRKPEGDRKRIVPLIIMLALAIGLGYTAKSFLF